MRTDKQLYTLLQTVPAWFTDLTGTPYTSWNNNANRGNPP